MKQINIYELNELPEDIQEKILNEYRYINIELGFWFADIKEDAEQIGLEITEYDHWHNTIKGHIVASADFVARQIIESHGKSTNTYKLAKRYMKQYNDTPENEDGEKISDAIDDSFEASLLRRYRDELKENYEYFQTDEAVRELIKANEWYFTKYGERVRS